MEARHVRHTCNPSIGRSSGLEPVWAIYSKVINNPGAGRAWSSVLEHWSVSLIPTPEQPGH